MDVLYYLALGVEGFIITVGFLMAAFVVLGIMVIVTSIVKGITGKLDK